MRVFRSTSDRPTLLGRVTAWSGVALVVLLAWLSVDPAAHAWLHAQEKDQAHGHACAGHGAHDDESDSLPAGDDDNCVITQFAQGHVNFAVAPLWVVAPERHCEVLAVAAIVAQVEQAEHRLPPGCGPPAV